MSKCLFSSHPFDLYAQVPLGVEDDPVYPLHVFMTTGNQFQAEAREQVSQNDVHLSICETRLIPRASE